MSLYGMLYRSLLLPGYEALRRRETLRHLEELDRTQWLPAERVRRRQWQRMKRMLQYAYAEVPFYKKAFDKEGVRPEEVRSWADFARLPLLEKRHLREHQEDLIARRYRREPLIVSHSGGSTGQPVEFRYHREFYDRRIAAWMRADRWAGWELGEPHFQLMLGVGSGVGQRALREVWKEQLHWRLMNWTTRTCTKLSREIVLQHYRLMARRKCRTFFSYGLSALAFGEFVAAEGLAPLDLAGIIVSGEKIFPHQKRRIEETLQAPVFERYGSQEFCNIAAECDRHEGMHINADGLHVEVVSADGQPLPAGEVGEVVVTSLDNFAMPFIRYRLGDMGAMAKGACPCGRGLPRIEQIVGRTLDMIVTPEGIICSGVIVPHFMKEFSCVSEFQFIQHSIDHLTLRMVPGPGWNAAARHYLEKELRRYIGPTMRLEFEERAELERAPSGKYRMVISKVPVSSGSEANDPARAAT